MLKCEHFIDSIYYQLEQTAKYCRYLGMQLFQKLNLPINLDEFVVLDTLLGHEGICQRDLAKILLKDRSNVTRILNLLEEKGLIYREMSQKSNRMVKVSYLTDKGQELIDKYADILKNDLNTFLSQFDQQKLLIMEEMLKKISSKISENANIQI